MSAAGDRPFDWAASCHPRPDLERREWWSLNGSWDFAAGDADYDRTIIVPFVHQSLRSGLAEVTKWDRVRYRRPLPVPEIGDGRLLLHFGAVDFAAEVVINGVAVGRHSGGHTSFPLDITDHVTSNDDVLEVVVDDSY